MDESKTDKPSESTTYSCIFRQIQESGDIISSILLMYKFITDNNISITFNVDKLRTIALRSKDNETSTCLWHINALIASSSDLKHLLLGIEIMFDRFLGNKNLFIREKEKEKEKETSRARQTIISTPQNKSKLKSKQNKNNNNMNKYIGKEIISFVNKFYEKNKDLDNNNNINRNCDNNLHEIHNKLKDMSIEHKNTENDNGINEEVNDENKEYMNKYCGKISSPISFRMRKQKRLIQNERRASRSSSVNTTRNSSVDIDYIDYHKTLLETSNNNNSDDINSISSSSRYEPEILSPFNVTKFAKIVDFEPQ